MLPSDAVRLALGELLAADSATLAPATDANKIKLVVSEFTPSGDLDITSLTLASFTGSTPLSVGVGTQYCGIDPATNEQVITMISPVGGWRWECTADPSTPQTVYGFIMTDLAGTALLGSALLPAPVTIAAAGEEIVIPSVSMRMVAEPLS